MDTLFTYSVLQYKHSLILGEYINVGILFHFPQNNSFEFVRGDATRVRAIYPNFDNSLFNTYIKTITEKLKQQVTLFNSTVLNKDFAVFVKENILAEDAAGLLFKEPVSVLNKYKSQDEVIKQYANLLLPGINTEKAYTVKHNENFILSTFKGYFQKESWEKRFQKNVIIESKNFKLKFELAFNNGQTERLIKPLSFDLSDEVAIQNKAYSTYGNLAALKDYAKIKKINIDLLIAEPQNSSLYNNYQNALDFIDSIDLSKKIIKQEDWQSYSQATYFSV